MKILLADDRNEERRHLRSILEKAGFVVVEAADGKAALGIAAKESPGLALLRAEMEGMDGYEAARQLQRGGFGGKIALLSGVICAPSRLNLIRQEGIADCLLTPEHPEFSPDEFLKKVREALEF